MAAARWRASKPRLWCDRVSTPATSRMESVGTGLKRYQEARNSRTAPTRSYQSVSAKTTFSLRKRSLTRIFTVAVVRSSLSTRE